MIKRKIDDFIKEYYKRYRNALLITGARQVGKTFSIRQFGKSFKSFIEINFVDMPDAVKIFQDAKSCEDILLRLSLLTSVPLIKGDTLIFFDEVQKCPNIVTAIKFLVDEGSYRYILSGSLLGVELKDLRSEPVGYMGVKEMYPIDLEEFFNCVGVSASVLDNLRYAWNSKLPIDDVIHSKMMQLLRLYLVVGGMPAAVNQFLLSNNLQNVIEVQREIISLYKRDIAQYDPENKLYINDIFNLIPSELNAKNKRFILKNLNEYAKFNRLDSSFLWLSNAGVALPVYNVEEPKVPLLLARSRNLFKLFQNDVGLLACQYVDGFQLRIINNESNINFGSIYENLIAQELTSHGFALYYYNNKKRGEVDFVIEYNGDILPVEVKSGKDYDFHRALSNIMMCSEYNIPKAIVFNNDNLKVVDNVIYAPIYMSMFLEKNIVAPIIFKPDLTGLQ